MTMILYDALTNATERELTNEELLVIVQHFFDKRSSGGENISHPLEVVGAVIFGDNATLD